MADRARQKTDKQLNEMERAIGRIFQNDPALNRIKKKYMAYMKDVEEATKDAYTAYKNETDTKRKAELKKAYMDEVKALTLENKKYKFIVSEFTHIMAGVNQQAIAIANSMMKKIYIENYNQVAVDCKEAGIRING